MISGEYGDIRYTIEYKNDPSLGAYYDIRLMIDETIKAHERELNLVRAIDTLAKSIKAWMLDEELVIVTPEKAQELLHKWNELNSLIDYPDLLSDEGQSIIKQMLPTLMQLREAGYEVTDEGEWYHPSEAN